MLDRYQIENAARQTDGYFNPRPHERVEDAFRRAQAECAAQLQAAAEHISALTYEQFAASRRGFGRRTSPLPSDDLLRAQWMAAGGEFHGPNVETGTMPETLLLPFLRALGPAQGVYSLEPSTEDIEQALRYQALGADEEIDGGPLLGIRRNVVLGFCAELIAGLRKDARERRENSSRAAAENDGRSAHGIEP
jgi:hypothetical protein